MSVICNLRFSKKGVEFKTLLELIIAVLFLIIVIYLITHNFRSELSHQKDKVNDIFDIFLNFVRYKL